MRFVLNGLAHNLDAQTVIERVRGVPPEAVRTHAVGIEGVAFPVKQAFELASRIDRAHFTSQTAVLQLQALGFEIIGPSRPSDSAEGVITAGPAASVDAGHQWPWEGAVQAVFVDVLQHHGWLVTATADTATKAPGIDVLAIKGDRRVGAEVKGWPSAGYADPRRAAEVKRTQPSTQAGHWFSQALFKAMMLLDSHPGYESLMVLPGFSRYRDLGVRTGTGRRAAKIHLVLLAVDGACSSDSWMP